MWRTSIAVSGLLIAGLMFSPAAHARSLDSGVRIAVHEQREARFVDVDGDTFHIKPMTFRQRDHRDGTARVLVEGQLSHHLLARPDDQYYYRIDLCGIDGTVMSFEERINRGGWANKLLTRRTLRVLSADGRIEILALLAQGARNMSNEGDSAWEASARLVALRVAAEIAAEVRPQVRDNRTGRNPRAQSACFQPRVTITP